MAVGETGLVLGFEPMPYMYESAREDLSVYRQYRLFCLGLGEKKEHMRFWTGTMAHA